MTGKQRLTAAMRGEAVDRAPIWLREGFPIGRPDPPPDDFHNAWQLEPIHRDLLADVAEHVDVVRGWGAGGLLNRFCMVHPRHIHHADPRIEGDVKIVRGWIETARGGLTFEDRTRRGEATWWQVEHPVKTPDDLGKLAETPWEFEPGEVEPHVSALGRAHEALGGRGVMRLGVSSPMVTISRCTSLETFLWLSVAERGLLHEVLGEVARRSLAVIDALFGGRGLDTTVNIGGSEQCTPPMMGPRGYDEFVVPYDGLIVRRLKEHGALVNCHCHGKVRHALRRMIEMGFDSTDPVEPPPAGDVTYAEARDIAGDQLTLVGNLEWSELVAAETDHIRRRVREILSHGSRRLVLAASAGPISAIDRRTADNYRAWVAAALEYG